MGMAIALCDDSFLLPPLVLILLLLSFLLRPVPPPAVRGVEEAGEGMGKKEEWGGEKGEEAVKSRWDGEEKGEEERWGAGAGAAGLRGDLEGCGEVVEMTAEKLGGWDFEEGSASSTVVVNLTKRSPLLNFFPPKRPPLAEAGITRPSGGRKTSSTSICPVVSAA